MPPVDRPVTRYATTEDDVHIAYQVLGNGPIDVVFVHAFVSHVELFWELPSYARFIRELSSWGRAIMFDKRGVGLSDRLSVVPTLEARIDDLRAVLDAVESERILVVGNSDGGALAAMFVATYPSGPSGSCSGAAGSGWPGRPTTRGGCVKSCSRSGSRRGWSSGATRSGARRPCA
jgi:pimeloyl-ACP methyl ester carboxylesterase